MRRLVPTLVFALWLPIGTNITPVNSLQLPSISLSSQNPDSKQEKIESGYCWKMQAFTSSLRNGSPNQKRSPSPKITRSSSISSDSVDSRASKVSPSSKLEKQRSIRVPENQRQWGQLMEELKREREEKLRAFEELAGLKKRNEEGSAQIEDRVIMLELEAEKAKESERKMLESLISQTKQLEQTKISLEEAKLEMRNLREKHAGNMGGSAGLSSHHLEKNESLTSTHAQEEIKKLRNELRLALQAEDKSKKAMDDFAFALKEVTSEATQAKAELAASKAQFGKAREDAEHAISLLQSTEQKLKEVLEGYDRMKLEHEESSAAWKAKEDSFRICMAISEEDVNKKDEENIRLAAACRLAREENLKLRDIIKQAVNEATAAKGSLEIARYENYDLKEQLSRMENALQQIRQDYESLKLNEAAALASAASAVDSNKASELLDVESYRQSKAANDDRKISRILKKFPSDRWTNKNQRIQNNHRHSVGEPDVFKDLAFDKEPESENQHAMFSSASNSHDIQLPSALFNERELNSDDLDLLNGMSFHDTEKEKEKKKKTTFGRFGDALRRRSFRKS